jgi:hypothetical protein
MKGFRVEGFIMDGFRPSYAAQSGHDLIILRKRFSEIASRGNTIQPGLLA